jgi:hypothetical protein
VLNDVGASVWRLLTDGLTIVQMTATISDEYQLPPELPPAQVESDIRSLITQLRDLGLVSMRRRDSSLAI